MDFPALSNFMGNCSHEDMVWEFADEDAAIRWYVGVCLPEQLEEVQAELDALLALTLSEDVLERVILDLGSSYDPACDGVNRADWLRFVRARLG